MVQAKDIMYNDGPTSVRGEDGKLKLEKAKGKETAVEPNGTGIPTHIRHMHERREVKHKHIHEHHGLRSSLY